MNPVKSFLSTSIRLRGLTAAFIPVIIHVSFLALLLYLHGRLIDYQQFTLHSKDVISHALTIQRDMLEIHINMRQYLMSSDSSIEIDFSQRKAAIDSSLSDLYREISDNASQTDLVEKIQSEFANYYDILDRTILLIDQSRIEDVKDIIKTSQTEKVYQVLDELFVRFRTNEEGLEFARHQALTELSDKIFYLLIGFLVIILCVCLYSIRLLDRVILSRIQRVSTNISLLAEGKPFAPQMQGDDEIARLDTALHILGRKLSERTAENEMFIYSVSHDLRSPLVNLRGFCEELGYSTKEISALVGSKKFDASSIARIKELIEKDLNEAVAYIKNSVTRLSVIIESLLKLSRAGRVIYQQQEVDLNEVVSRVIESLRESSNKKEATVTKDELPTVIGDPSALDQIFGNLIDNAITYLDPDKKGEIHIGCDSERSSVFSTVIFVRDNGLGILSEHHPKIFTAFQRFHSNRAVGEGIGLAMTKRIVEQLLGTIWFESVEKQGTTFFVQLPLPGSQEFSFQLSTNSDSQHDQDHVEQGTSE